MDDSRIMQIGTRYNEKAAEAIAALEHNTHFQYLVEYWTLRKYHLAILASKQADDVQSRWHQGRSQEMAQLVDECKTARKNIEFIRNNGRVK